MCARKFGIVQPVLHTGSQNGQGSRHIASGSLLAPLTAALGELDGELEGELDDELEGMLDALLLGVLLGE
jgi:hypothetical protein